MNIDFSLGGLANSSLSRARKSQLQSMTNMAAGHRRDLSRTDSGAYSLSQRVQSEKRFESGLSSTLQNAMSIAHTQSESLGQMQKILTKMSEIASLAGSVSSNANAKETYQAQFDGLIEDFNNFAELEINDTKIFGTSQSEEGKELLDSLKSHWLAATEKLVLEKYGWEADPDDSWDLVIEENGAKGGSAAFVQSSWSSSDYVSQVTKLSIDLPDLQAPHTVGNSTADTLIAHEMVHLLQAQNTYMGDQAGGEPGRDMAWFAEGLAELIRGADSSVSRVLNSGTSVPDIVKLPGAGWNGGEADYAAAYLAVKFLDDKIRSSHSADGIKNLTTWMKTQKDAGAGAALSGLNEYLKTELGGYTPGAGETYTDKFLEDFEGSNGQNFVNSINLTNSDTGSIAGSDYGGSPLEDADIVNDDSSYISGFTSKLSYEEDDSNDPVTLTVSDGISIQLNTIDTFNFGDASIYDLTTENGAKLTIDRVDELLELLANNISKVGSNMTAIENHTNLLSVRQVSMANKLENIQGVSIADELNDLSASKILLDANFSMRAQALNIQKDVSLMLLSAA
jgi:flagellin-like hook-associated protein FlgL